MQQPQQRFTIWEMKLGIYDKKNTREMRLKQFKDLKINPDEDERLDIMKDISRTYQELELFQNEDNQQLICNVLLIWCYNGLSYRQGMNELMGVIYYTYRQQYPIILDPIQSQSDLYWVFKYIMDDGNHKEMFNYCAKSKIENTPLIKHIQHLTDQLSLIDNEVYEIFKQNSISKEIFLMKWIKCLLAREFEIDQIQIIWDKIFEYFYEHQLKFVDAIIISMMIHLKPRLLKIEDINNFEVLFLFQNYPSKSDYYQILEQSIPIFKKLNPKKIKTSEIVKLANPSYGITIIISYIQKLFRQ